MANDARDCSRLVVDTPITCRHLLQVVPRAAARRLARSAAPPPHAARAGQAGGCRPLVPPPPAAFPTTAAAATSTADQDIMHGQPAITRAGSAARLLVAGRLEADSRQVTASPAGFCQGGRPGGRAGCQHRSIRPAGAAPRQGGAPGSGQGGAGSADRPQGGWGLRGWRYGQPSQCQRPSSHSQRRRPGRRSAWPSPLAPRLRLLCALQGVGPATASAVLEAYEPSIPFSSDQAMLAALDSKDYTGAVPLGAA